MWGWWITSERQEALTKRLGVELENCEVVEIDWDRRRPWLYEDGRTAPIWPFLPTLKCIALQMAFIGLLSGMYGTAQLRELRLFPTMLDAGCQELDALIRKEQMHGIS